MYKSLKVHGRNIYIIRYTVPKAMARQISFYGIHHTKMCSRWKISQSIDRSVPSLQCICKTLMLDVFHPSKQVKDCLIYQKLRFGTPCLFVIIKQKLIYQHHINWLLIHNDTLAFSTIKTGCHNTANIADTCSGFVLAAIIWPMLLIHVVVS